MVRLYNSIGVQKATPFWSDILYEDGVIQGRYKFRSNKGLAKMWYNVIGEFENITINCRLPSSVDQIRDIFSWIGYSTAIRHYKLHYYKYIVM